MKRETLTTSNPLKALLIFALPMILSVTLQQLYNICDSLIAGKYISDNALAAVSASYPVTQIYLAFAVGFGAGANIICARYFGQKSYKDVMSSINTALITIVAVAILLGTIGFIFTDDLLRLINVKDIYFNDASIYLKYYTAGLIFLFIYNCVTYLFQAVGNSRIPLYFLIFSTALNIILDLCLVKTLQVQGLALGTLIAQGVASIASLIILMIYTRKLTGEKGKAYDKSIILKILPIAIPAILQQSFVSVGGVFIQALINSYGETVTAGYGAAYKIVYVIVNIYFVVSNALSTFVSTNAGAKKYDRIMKGYWGAMLFCGILTVVVTTIFLLLPGPLLSIFGNENTSEEVVSIGKTFIYCVAPFYFLLCIKIPSDGLLKGAGDMREFMVGTFADLLVRVILSYILAYNLPEDKQIIGIFLTWPIGWLIGAASSFVFSMVGNWKKRIGYTKEINQNNN